MTKIGKIVLLTLCSVVFVFFPSVARGATYLEYYEISEDTHWTQSMSPYVIYGGLTIAANVTLTIDPGVVVKLDNAGVTVFGSIVANGQPGAKVVFTSIYDDVGGDTNEDGESYGIEGDWSGFNFIEPTAPSRFTYTDFAYSAHGLFFQKASVEMVETSIIDSGEGMVSSNSSVSCTNCTLSRIFRNAFVAFDASTFSFLATHIEDVEQGDAMAVFGNSKGTIAESGMSMMGSGTGSSGLAIFDGGEVTINKSIFTDLGGDGGGAIVLFNSDGFRPSKVSVTEYTFTGGFGSGIVAFGNTNVSVVDSKIESFFGHGMESFLGSTLSVLNSTIRNNTNGINLYDSSLSLVRSAVYGNLEYGLYNHESTIVDAKENYWGDATGPYHAVINPGGLGDEVSDNVTLKPWLTEDPTLEVVCCSSVAFIPGLQASRLYKKGLLFENQLWEPNRNEDVKSLYLNTGGASIESSIYTKDIVDEAFGINVYKGFMQFLNTLVSDKVINEWSALPYDWRFDLNAIAQGSIALSNQTTYTMAEKIEALAATSKTGKVTLITHSNGGLVVKKLVDHLSSMGKGTLVDKVIMVAAPELGTPKTIPALLHGYDQSMGFGMLLSQSVARGLGENMQSAYNLLPSKKYFSKVNDPVVTFDSSIDTVSNLRKIYGESVTSFEELQDFLKGTQDGRIKPIASNTASPNVLQPALLARSEANHSALDMWIPPYYIKVIHILGWGLDTVKSIAYGTKEQTACPVFGPCQTTQVLDYKPVFTTEGDQTVVVPSALGPEGTNYFVDIQKHNKELAGLKRNRSHIDMLEMEELQEYIKNILTGKNDVFPKNISFAKPALDKNYKSLRLTTPSPVSLDIYDSYGNHTGPIQNPDPNSDVEQYEANVPNSYYMPVGDVVYAGASHKDVKSIAFAGTGVGTLTFQADIFAGADLEKTTQFTDIPVTPVTKAEVVIPSGTTTAVLVVDVDGDGTTDFTVKPSAEFNPILYLEMMKKTIVFLDIKKAVKDAVVKRIDKVLSDIQKGKIEKAEKKMKRYIVRIKKVKTRRLAESDTQTILDMMNTLLDELK